MCSDLYFQFRHFDSHRVMTFLKFPSARQTMVNSNSICSLNTTYTHLKSWYVNRILFSLSLEEPTQVFILYLYI